MSVTAWQNPLRDPARPPPAARRGPLRARHLRRHGRLCPAEADAGRLTTSPTGCCRRASRSRVRPPRVGGPGLRPGRPRLGQGARPHALPRGGLGAARRGMRFIPRATSTTTPRSEQLRAAVDELDEKRAHAAAHYAFYLSVPPKFFPKVVRQLKKHGLADAPQGSWRAPSSRSRSARHRVGRSELNAIVHDVFAPWEQVFRIDHYLGKETVQNILALRFANQMYEPIWNRSYVDHVQITMAEDIGIGGRAGYYDGIGAARDVIQNHLLQLMALTAMEEPASFDAESLVTEKLKVAQVRPDPRRPGEVHGPRAQYAAGWQGGEKVRATSRKTASTRVEDRHLRRREAGGGQPPLGGRPVLPAHRQAPGPSRHRDRGRLPARAPHSRSTPPPPRNSARTRSSSASSRTRA